MFDRAPLSSFFLGQWFQKGSRRRGLDSAQSAAAALRMSSHLEQRALMSGTTNVTFSSGTLTLTSLNDLTQAGVLNGNNDNVIVLTGGGVGVVNLSGFGELFTGAGTSFTGVTKINVVANDGGDSVTLTNVNITGAVSIQGGDGDNSVNGSGGSLGSLTVTNGDGEDVTNYSAVTIAGAVSITNGEGATNSTFTNVTFGSLKITNLDGSDDLLLTGSNTINGTTQIDNGIGSANITFDGTANTLNGALTITNGEGHEHNTSLSFNTARAITINNAGGTNRTSINAGAITGAVAISNGEGDDEFEMSGITPVSITGNLTINHRSGGSRTELRGTVTGNVSVTAQAGFDVVTAPNPLLVTGTTSISLGNGDSEVDLTSGGTLTFGGALSVTTADGDDEFSISSPTAVNLRNVTLNYGTGESKTSIIGTITGNLSITARAGDDEVLAPGQLAVTGTTTMELGNGDSKVDLRSNGTLSFGGNLNITSGDGDDEFKIDSPSAIALKGVSINWGTGDSEVEFSGTSISMEALSVTGNFGDHKVKFDGDSLTTRNVTLNFSGRRTSAEIEGKASVMNVNGNLAITLGGGVSGSNGIDFEEILNVTGTTNIRLANGNEEVQLRGGGTLTGNVTVSGGGGNDLLLLECMTLVGNLSTNMGTGNDTVKIDDSTFRGTVNVALGAGSDRVLIEQEDTDEFSRFEKAVTLNGDAGADDFEIGLANDANDFAQFLLAFSMNGGNGLDHSFFKNGGQGGTRFNLFGVVPNVTNTEVQV